MLIVSVVMMFLGLAGACYLLVFTARNATSALAYFGLTIIAGVAIPNLPHITRLGGEYSKGKSSVGLEIQQAVADVKTGVGQVQIDKSEVAQIKNQVQILANKIKDADARVAQSEQNVSQMRDNVREAYRALAEAVAFTFYTRNLFPPPKFISDDIAGQLDKLMLFAYPDPIERSTQMTRMIGMIKQAEPTPVPTPAPTAKPN